MLEAWPAKVKDKDKDKDKDKELLVAVGKRERNDVYKTEAKRGS